jgi:hypothetical protein
MLEAIARIQHEIWSHWVKYLISVSKENEDGSYTIPWDKIDKWKRQSKKPYARLLPQEQKASLEQAQKIVQSLIEFGNQNNGI